MSDRYCIHVRADVSCDPDDCAACLDDLRERSAIMTDGPVGPAEADRLARERMLVLVRRRAAGQRELALGR